MLLECGSDTAGAAGVVERCADGRGSMVDDRLGERVSLRKQAVCVALHSLAAAVGAGTLLRNWGAD